MRAESWQRKGWRGANRLYGRAGGLPRGRWAAAGGPVRRRILRSDAGVLLLLRRWRSGPGCCGSSPGLSRTTAPPELIEQAVAEHPAGEHTGVATTKGASGLRGSRFVAPSIARRLCSAAFMPVDRFIHCSPRLVARCGRNDGDGASGAARNALGAAASPIIATAQSAALPCQRPR